MPTPYDLSRYPGDLSPSHHNQLHNQLSEWMESRDWSIWSVTTPISEGSESFNGNLCRLKKKQLLLGVGGGGC